MIEQTELEVLVALEEQATWSGRVLMEALARARRATGLSWEAFDAACEHLVGAHLLEYTSEPGTGTIAGRFQDGIFDGFRLTLRGRYRLRRAAWQAGHSSNQLRL